MGLSVADFKERFPEFVSAEDALVSAKLEQALRSIDVAVWEDFADDGQGQLAAHLLALSPFGMQASLRMGGGANQRTVYQDTYEGLARRVGTAHRLVLE